MYRAALVDQHQDELVPAPFAVWSRVVLRTAVVAASVWFAAAAGLTVPADGASRAKAKTHSATCDEVPGVNQAVNDRWRVFNPAESDTDLAIEPEVWVCRRSSRAVRRILPLPFASSASTLVGDVVEADGSGRYNAYGQLIDLANLSAIQRYDDGTGGDLLSTGAVVLRPARTDTGAVPPTTGAPGTAHEAGGLTVFDGAGRQTFETSVTWMPSGSDTPFRLGNFPSAALPFAGGFYYAAPDGTLRRFAPSGAASTAAWPRNKRLKWKRYRTRVKRTKGVKVSYVGLRELRARAAKGGRPASLTLNTPSSDSLQGSPRRSDLSARLVPGSESELKLIGGFVLGRFTDRPGDLRLRLPNYDKPGQFLLDLAAPASLDVSSLATGYGEFAFLDATELLLLRHDDQSGTFTQQRLPAPAGAHDLAFVRSGTSIASGWLVYTGANGQPAALKYLDPAPR